MLTKDKVKAFMKQQNMLAKGDHILIGFSGGADSVCLFHILQSLAKEYEFKLTAVHVEHGIRGEEALRDATFVQKLCERENVPCFVEHVSVPSLAAEAGLSEEEMGRKVRYEIFEQRAKQVGANKIAVAHHKNDVAETMLFHLCRGTGLAGLCALSPVRGNLIRPLLAVNREEIEDYLREEKLAYCSDSTNEETDYTRNYLRREVLPLLKDVNPKVVEHMAQTSLLLEGAKEALEESVVEKKTQYTEEREAGVFVKNELFQVENDYFITGVLHNVIEDLAGSKKDIHFKHINSVAELGSMQVGKRVSLPYGLIAIKEYEGVAIKKNHLDTTRMKSKNQCGLEETKEEMLLNIPGETFLWNGEKVQTRIFSVEEVKDINKIPDKKCTKWFDYDIINECISVRYRQPGDYMVIDEEGGRKKLKDLLINEKIPQKNRDELLLFAVDHLVLWALGVRMGEFGKINSDTKRILEINIYGGKSDE